MFSLRGAPAHSDARRRRLLLTLQALTPSLRDLESEFVYLIEATRALTPEEILGLTRAAYGKMPQGLLVTVAGKDFSFVERLSDEAQAAIPGAVDKALSWLAPYLAR